LEPASGSVTRYESSTSPKGIRTEYNTVAADRRDPEAVTEEIVIEASISKAGGTEMRGFFFPRPVETEPRTYFSLGASLRLRDEQYNTRTRKCFTVGAMRDPNDPASFIVDYALQGAPDLQTAFRVGGMQAVKQEKRDNPALTPRQIFEAVRNTVANNAPLFETLRADPNVTTATVALGQGPS
jgi:hypothetical protein